MQERRVILRDERGPAAKAGDRGRAEKEGGAGPRLRRTEHFREQERESQSGGEEPQGHGAGRLQSLSFAKEEKVLWSEGRGEAQGGLAWGARGAGTWQDRPCRGDVSCPQGRAGHPWGERVPPTSTSGLASQQLPRPVKELPSVLIQQHQQVGLGSCEREPLPPFSK